MQMHNRQVVEQVCVGYRMPVQRAARSYDAQVLGQEARFKKNNFELILK
jgi:hypothetical protein